MSHLQDTLDIVDRITDDLEGHIHFPPGTRTERYARPDVVAPEHCPLFAVYTQTQSWELIATPATYDMRPTVEVAYYTAAPREAEMGGADIAGVVADNILTSDAIADRLATYPDGIPDLTQKFARIRRTTTERREGLVYAVIFTLEVER